MDEELEELIDKAIFFVEATSYEHHALWVINHDQEKFIKSWKSGGIFFPVEIARKQYVEIGFDTLDGQLVAFYNPLGPIIDVDNVKKWRNKIVGNKKWDKKALMGDGKTYGRPAYSNAWNFGHCIHAIREANGTEI